MTKIKAIISDADGTLVNTLHLIRHGQYETAKTYLTEHGIPTSEIPDYDEYQEHLLKVLGGSARETLERAVRLVYAGSPHHLEGMDFDRLHDLLNPIQDKIAPDYVKAFPGLNELLKWMGENRVSLAVFTSGTPHHVVRNFGVALPELGLTNLFTETDKTDEVKMHQFEAALQDYFGIPTAMFVTCDDVSASKPDPESLLVALDRLKIEKSEAAVLGDHWVDMEAGVNAGVGIRIGVSHGFDDKAALKKAGATKVIGSLEELPNVLHT